MPENAEAIGHLVDAASIIIRAKVSQIGASNEPTVPAGPQLVVAEIETVYRAGPTLGNLVGRAVTIDLVSGHSLQPGQQRIFFANGLVYGSQIVLREVAQRNANAEIERDIERALRDVPLRHLESRLQGAELVIVGAVERIRPSEIREPISFHSPKWMVADLRISEALKGDPKGTQVHVLFPSARDVLWANAPRLQEHQEGIFLLHRGVAKWGAPPDALTALDPADVHPTNALSQVRRLLGRQ